MSNNNNNNNNNNKLNELQHFSTDFRRGTVAVEDITRSSTIASRRQIDINEKNNDNNNNNNNNNGRGLSSSSSIKSNSPLSNDLAFGLINSNKLDSKRFEYEQEPEQKQKQERQEEAEEEEESSPKETTPMVAWQEEVDRFSNFVTKKQMTHLQLYSAVETILQGFQTSYNSKNTDSHIKKDSENSTFSGSLSKVDFAYTLFNNLFLCKITEDADQTTEFSVGIYTYQEDKCLLDVQKLEGDHFVFTHFFENLKTALRDQDIIHTPTIKKEVLDIYGLDVDIGLEIFN